MARRVEVYDDPRPGPGAASYAKAARFGPDDDLPLVLDDREVARVRVRDLLPEEKTP